MTWMTSHLNEDPRPDQPRQYRFPAGIFVAVPPRKPAPPLEGAFRMLRRPAFWAAMLVLTVLMFIGALMLSDHLRDTAPRPFQNPGRVHYALSL